MMNIYINGTTREMTLEEEQKFKEEQFEAKEQELHSIPTADERLEALEASMLDMILGGE